VGVDGKSQDITSRHVNGSKRPCREHIMNQMNQFHRIRQPHDHDHAITPVCYLLTKGRSQLKDKIPQVHFGWVLVNKAVLCHCHEVHHDEAEEPHSVDHSLHHDENWGGHLIIGVGGLPLHEFCLISTCTRHTQLMLTLLLELEVRSEVKRKVK
jgi:hypothetical protein